MSITKKEFGVSKGGEKVYSYMLENTNGMKVEILNYGGILRSIIVKDKNGNDVDVLIGRNSMDEYYTNNGYLGALIGRHANRIAKSEFEINGVTYKVGANEGGNSLHGGFVGFDKKVWAVEEKDGDDVKLMLSLFSPDGEEGFPGNVNVVVTYTLTKDNSLKINYRAVSDKDTVFNMTNHAYFNLSGFASGVIDDEKVYINSSFFTPNDDECMPTGEVWSVAGTPFDLREMKKFSDGFSSDYEQIKMFEGYDHNFIIDGRGYRIAAVTKSDKTGIKMETWTDQSSMQLYTANALDKGTFKDGVTCSQHHGYCLETQCFPNSMKFAHYPDALLKANEVYDTTTEYKFSIED